MIGKPHDKGALLFFFVRGDVPSIVRCIESARTVFSNVFFFIFGRELRDRYNVRNGRQLVGEALLIFLVVDEVRSSP